MTPRRGATYALAGSVAGVPVAATTVVPFRFDVSTPTGDTLQAVPGTCPFATTTSTFRCLPFAFQVDGATAFEVRIADGANAGSRPVRVDSGVLSFFPDLTPRAIALIGYNSDAAGWLFSTTPQSNLTGAFGGFGAAIVVRRILYVP